jgi:prevent-host-death family protein
MDVGVRELKLHLSQYLARVRAGATVTVTDRGKPVARLEPVENLASPPAAVKDLVESGGLIWRPPLRGFTSAIRLVPGEKMAVDFVRDQRR